MKEREIDQRVQDVPKSSGGGDAGKIDVDARPPGATESTTRHIFLMREGAYRCSRCGAPMNDRTLDEECPVATSG
ncbi:MAG TPA: hypothetical protein VGQ32_04905 [Thermoanaerobaculia bacterium]|jgi:rubrerythrin|nr:hypothetical protein [Thermoanaerobaculia bacterium]